MKVLIPLISRHESNPEFIDKAVKGTEEVLLLIVIDKDDSLKASDISSSTHFLEEVKKLIGKKRKKCEDLTEWGETKAKIKNTAIINKVDKIVLLKQENQFFEDLIEELKKEKELKNKIELIEIDFEKQEQEQKEFEDSLNEIEEKTSENKTENAEEEKENIQEEKIKENKTKGENKIKNKTINSTEKVVKNAMKDTKVIADKLIKQGFKSIDSIKKIKWK